MSPGPLQLLRAHQDHDNFLTFQDCPLRVFVGTMADLQSLDKDLFSVSADVKLSVLWTVLSLLSKL